MVRCFLVVYLLDLRRLGLVRYAMERTDSYIKIWFWARDAGTVPSDVRDAAPSVNPNSWVCYAN